jgi:hypothetical protein
MEKEILSNIWVISRLANSMKNSATFYQLEKFCENISKVIKSENLNIKEIFPNVKMMS